MSDEFFTRLFVGTVPKQRPVRLAQRGAAISAAAVAFAFASPAVSEAAIAIKARPTSSSSERIDARPQPAPVRMTAASAAPHFDGMFERIVKFAALAAGWDGPKSLPPSKEAQSAARVVGKAFANAAAEHTDYNSPQVAPLAEGGYQFEWHRGERELYVSCNPAGELDILEVGPDRESEYHGDLSRLSEALQWFFAA